MSGDQVTLVVSMIGLLAFVEYIAVAALVLLEACVEDVLEKRRRDRVQRPNLTYFHRKFRFTAATDSDAADVLIELREDVPLDRRLP